MRRALLITAALIAAQSARADSVVAGRVIRVGEVLRPADVLLQPDEVSGAAQSLDQVLGLEARALIYTGRAIRLDQIGAPTIVSRNQPILLIYRSYGLRIEVEGRALDRGSIGEAVRAMNLASRRTVVGRVQTDGTISVGEGR